MRTKLEVTADGSHTLFVPELDEHYHSVNGAVQEANHVFIETGLRCCHKADLRVFEVGFGTGLNAFLTLLDNMDSERTIHYTSIEAYPVPMDIVSQLNFAKTEEDKQLLLKLHSVQWSAFEPISDSFCLKKIEADFTNFNFSEIGEVDLIYFDAFAPDKQTEMWTPDLFQKLYDITADNGILVTYCAKGAVRRMMQHVGYCVERLPGPVGKREMLRAKKILNNWDGKKSKI